MRTRVSIMLWLVVTLATAQVSQPLFPTLTDEQLTELLPTPGTFQPVPPAKDAFWRRLLPGEMAADYTANAEQYRGAAWDDIPDSVFAQFRRNGNRTNYERLHFALRTQLACLVMGEVMEHQGRFTADIVRGLHYFQRESWWGLPAHYPTDHPKRDNQVVDLFNAETANMLAWTVYMLHDEIEQQEAGLSEAIRQEIDRRMLTPCRTARQGWKRLVNNWNTWICENWLSCIMLCENDARQQQEAIGQAMQSLNTFYRGYPDDGGCEEGQAYWDRAAGSFFVGLSLLDSFTGHRMTFSDNDKLKAMGAFAYKTYIGNGYSVNFADAQPRARINVNVLYPFGQYVRDDAMTGYAALIAREAGFAAHPAALYNKSGNYPSLSRELLFLCQYHQFKSVAPREPLLQGFWLDRLQVFTARTSAGSSRGYFLAAKGGHNNESHNHNDVGSFIVYHDAQPVIIDIGVGTYTSLTFSKRRYELFNCRSSYHNVPLVNGMEQHDGKQYRAKDATGQHDRRSAAMTLDLAATYPAEAKVRKWVRTMRLDGKRGVTVTEDYELDEWLQPSEVVLISCGETKVERSGRIAIVDGATHHVRYDHRKMTATVERIETDDTLIRNAWQQKPLYRIRLTLNGNDTKGKVTYSID